ncbi:ribosomal-protein-alanine acetyltransferase [Sphingobacterium spiritivorum]|uniref:Ribosomal-protein-alanine acetyltransferase n=1 Tax=Sphingobacterium spiritivorum TaxID=258 RepID=A0A380CIC0_SPHSI|nr:GNAT family N-acetyltransferase [Sphingobacterium spiritivorum]SUJ19737.1 ribosomal-protein-alanine acetyltransferase [Sphingobacterium spiritivorum]
MKVIENTIPADIYRQLRVAAGLSPKTQEAAKTGLRNSIHSVMIQHENQIIGMGRIIGDAGCFCQVVDIAVLPEYQGQGVGKMIIRNLMDFINTNLPSSCYVSLIADGDASFLYEKFGFKDTLPASRGMAYKVQ